MGGSLTRGHWLKLRGTPFFRLCVFVPLLLRQELGWRSLHPVQVVQMAKYLTTGYVSGWQCSSTASSPNEPGLDVADYRYDIVPTKVDQLSDRMFSTTASSSKSADGCRRRPGPRKHP